MQRPRLTMTGLRKAAALVRRLLLPVNCLYAAKIRSLSAIRALKQLSSGIFSNENRQLFLDSPNARRSFSCCAVRDDFPAMRKKYSSFGNKGILSNSNFIPLRKLMEPSRDITFLPLALSFSLRSNG